MSKEDNPTKSGAGDPPIKSGEGSEVEGRALPTVLVACQSCGMVREVVVRPGQLEVYLCDGCKSAQAGLA